MMTLKLWTVILPLIAGAPLMVCLMALPYVQSQDEHLSVQEECMLPASLAANETQGATTDAQLLQESSCTDKEYNPEEDELITEASYTPPFNHTYPAPKTAQGIGSDMGEPQELDLTYSSQIFARIEKSRDYIQGKVMVEDKYISVRSICQNKHASCAFWSVLGECENNPAYMQINCAPVCESCEVRI
jgi:ShK domain-like